MGSGCVWRSEKVILSEKHRESRSNRSYLRQKVGPRVFHARASVAASTSAGWTAIALVEPDTGFPIDPPRHWHSIDDQSTVVTIASRGNRRGGGLVTQPNVPLEGSRTAPRG